MHLEGYETKRERRGMRREEKTISRGKRTRAFSHWDVENKITYLADHGDRSRMQLIPTEWESDVLFCMADTEKHGC